LEYSEPPLIVLLGNSGSISRALEREILQMGLRSLNLKISRQNSITESSFINERLDCNLKKEKYFFIVNTIASLNPKTKSDYYVNEFLPLDLLKYANKNNGFLIHLSTNNISNINLIDLYTNQKRNGEQKILKSNFLEYMIIRLPLVLPLKDIQNNLIPYQYKLLVKFLKLPFIAIVPPSRNIYRPMSALEVAKIILSKVINFKKEYKQKIISLNGKREMNLLDISKDLLEIIDTNKKKIIQVPMIWFLVDIVFIKFPQIKEKFKKNTFLQQFLNTKR